MKIAYLTIDDAPSSDFKNKIRYMASKNIPAIIFCIGIQINDYQEDLIEAIKNGFVIGSHSFTHTKFSELSVPQIESEISRTDTLIENLYTRANVGRQGKFIRLPYGDGGGKNEQDVQLLLKKYGYEPPLFYGVNYAFCLRRTNDKRLDVPWTFNVMEYQFKHTEDVRRRLETKNWPLGVDLSQNGGYLASDSAEIVIIHDHSKTSNLFVPIIEELEARGIAFKAMGSQRSKSFGKQRVLTKEMPRSLH